MVLLPFNVTFNVSTHLGPRDAVCRIKDASVPSIGASIIAWCSHGHARAGATQRDGHTTLVAWRLAVNTAL